MSKPEYSGDGCSQCGNYTMRYAGNKSICDSCGASYHLIRAASLEELRIRFATMLHTSATLTGAKSVELMTRRERERYETGAEVLRAQANFFLNEVRTIHDKRPSKNRTLIERLLNRRPH